MVTSGPTDPGTVLFGRTRRRLLAWLFGHPDEAFFLRDLLRRTGTPEGGAQRDLAALTAAGLLTRSVRGRQVFFQANQHSPIYPELLSLLTKTAGIAGVLKEALQPLSRKISLAFVYGSAARNELRSNSDVDLMVVGDAPFADVVDAVRGAETRLGREVNATVYPVFEFTEKIHAGHHFLTAVLQTPMLFVVGDRDDLERLGGPQSLAGRTSHIKRRDRESARGRRTRSARQSGRRAQR